MKYSPPSVSAWQGDMGHMPVLPPNVKYHSVKRGRSYRVTPRERPKKQD